MAYLTVRDAQEAFARSQTGRSVRRTAGQVLNESAASVTESGKFDIFLSHCLKDAEHIAGVKAYLEENGLKVYVDWIVDAQMSRERVSPDTANTLRRRMRASDSMIFATSENSPSSKWMPWELGYFDGLRQGRVAVLPLLPTPTSAFIGQEYLGLYPTVEKLPTNTGGERPYITRGASSRQAMTVEEFKRGATVFRTY